MVMWIRTVLTPTGTISTFLCSVPVSRNLRQVLFIYYVSTIWGFFDPLPPYVSIFYVLKISNKKNCPPPPSSAYVIYEWSPSIFMQLSIYSIRVTYNNYLSGLLPDLWSTQDQIKPKNETIRNKVFRNYG